MATLASLDFALAPKFETAFATVLPAKFYFPLQSAAVSGLTPFHSNCKAIRRNQANIRWPALSLRSVSSGLLGEAGEAIAVKRGAVAYLC
jgi:hypothetical protein